jgi:hypothetical protein
MANKKQSEDDKAEMTSALADLLWDYLKRDPNNKNRRVTGWGTKTKIGLRRSIEACQDKEFMRSAPAENCGAAIQIERNHHG